MNTQAHSPAAGDGTVGKALDVLDLVAAFGRPVRFSAILEASPLPKATLYRMLQTLTNQGMLTQDPDTQAYALGLRLVRLAHEAWRQSSLAPIARPFIDALAAEVQETVHLAQMDAGQVIYVDKRNATDPIEMFSQAGKVGPAYCTGVGKAMLAHLTPDRLQDALSRQSFHDHTPATLDTAIKLMRELDDIRASGVAYDREEHEPGIICIAAPILSSPARVIGALSITTSTARHALDTLDGFKPALLRAAEDIGGAAHDWQFPSDDPSAHSPS
ncbi:IclR family transcriptional regulator [Pseudaestuariivita atlantica]|uniref:IclR family transcriptional regulator n=1 Tax=Pseudaestuariivita atlantica TaxID=1317121 RepID=A0A0L1JMS1_9RHOB|nr:IclR family transcriptional regulator [Pseudaestuariivita atlantica]KNG92713.1 IclR family transcriptional regulator [Pseudaestuariivita atlantica]